MRIARGRKNRSKKASKSVEKADGVLFSTTKLRPIITTV
jgi:hypothetical protein